MDVYGILTRQGHHLLPNVDILFYALRETTTAAAERTQRRKAAARRSTVARRCLTLLRMA